MTRDTNDYFTSYVKNDEGLWMGHAAVFRRWPIAGDSAQRKSSATGKDRARLSVSGNQSSIKPATNNRNTKERSSPEGTSCETSFGTVRRQPGPLGDSTVGINLAWIAARSLLPAPSKMSAAPSAVSSNSLRILVRSLEPVVPTVG